MNFDQNLSYTNRIIAIGIFFEMEEVIINYQM